MHEKLAGRKDSSKQVTLDSVRSFGKLKGNCEACDFVFLVGVNVSLNKGERNKGRDWRN